ALVNIMSILRHNICIMDLKMETHVTKHSQNFSHTMRTKYPLAMYIVASWLKRLL
ncbi:hypothetical protein ACJX0J_040959, partial [Zea mays]